MSSRIRAALKKIPYQSSDNDEKNVGGNKIKTLSDYYLKTSQHSLRKLYSTETFIFLKNRQYEREIAKGYDEDTAMACAKKFSYDQTVGVRLGHGRGRSGLYYVYIDVFL